MDLKQRLIGVANRVQKSIREAMRIMHWVIPFRNSSLLLLIWVLLLTVVLGIGGLAVASLFWPSLWVSLEDTLPVAPGNLLYWASLLFIAMLLLGNLPRMMRSVGCWHRIVIWLMQWSHGGKAGRFRSS